MALVSLLLFSCVPNQSETVVYPDSLLQDYSNPRGANDDFLFISMNDDFFLVVRNDFVRCLIYYNHYRDLYPDYFSFLKDGLNNPGSIPWMDYCHEENLIRADKLLIKRVKKNPQKYLAKWSGSDITYDIKPKYKKQRFQILKAMFDLGYFIGYSDYDGSYSVCEELVLLPPLFPDEQ